MTVPIPPERRATPPVGRPAPAPAERGAAIPPEGGQRLRPRVIGLAIGTLINGVAVRSVRIVRTTTRPGRTLGR